MTVRTAVQCPDAENWSTVQGSFQFYPERVKKRIFLIITIIWWLGKRERGMDREREREGVEKEGGMKGRKEDRATTQWEKG